MNPKVLHLIVLFSLCYGFGGISGDRTAQLTSEVKNGGSAYDKVVKLNLTPKATKASEKEKVNAAENERELEKTTKPTSTSVPTTSSVPPPTITVTVPHPTTTSSTVPPPTATSTVPPSTATSTVPPPTTTSTVPPPTTTPLPTPDNKGDWELRYGNSSAICTRLVAEIELKVGYKAKNSSGGNSITIPKTAKSSGNCTSESMVLSWPTNVNETATNNFITFDFKLDNSSHFWKLANVSGLVHVTVPSVTPPNNQTIHLTFHSTNADIFDGHVGTSYVCVKSNSYNVSLDNSSYSDVNITWAALTFSQLQVEAFKQESANTSNFGSPNNCELTPDIVPIVVGCALACLVVIVLVAYLIAQRRPSAQGYRSV